MRSIAKKKTCFKVKKSIRSDRKIDEKLELMNKIVLELKEIEKTLLRKKEWKIKVMIRKKSKPLNKSFRYGNSQSFS